jgi:hypothetical protein
MTRMNRKRGESKHACISLSRQCRTRDRTGTDTEPVNAVSYWFSWASGRKSVVLRDVAGGKPMNIELAVLRDIVREADKEFALQSAGIET